MQALETYDAARLALAVQRGRIVLVPCGHQEDALSLETTHNLLLYCQRCERGFDSPLVLA